MPGTPEALVSFFLYSLGYSVIVHFWLTSNHLQIIMGENSKLKYRSKYMADKLSQNHLRSYFLSQTFINQLLHSKNMAMKTDRSSNSWNLHYSGKKQFQRKKGDIFLFNFQMILEKV